MRGALLALLALLAAGCSDAPPRRVLVVGVDGASWKVIGPLLEAGELPTFERLLHEGASTRALSTLDPTWSPRIWTSVATGRKPEVHGVEEFVETLPDGTRIPVTSRARRVPALWEVAQEHGRSAGVIGWWASWPAEPLPGGFVVTDHANPASTGWLVADGRYWTADREALERLEHDVHPVELAPRLAERWLTPESFPYEEMARTGRLSEAQLEQLRQAPFNRRTPYSWLKTFYAVDRPHAEIAADLWHEHPTDLLMLYLRGPDPVQHYAWDLVEPERYARPPENLERDRGLVEAVYRHVDRQLGELLREVGDDAWVIVLSDHGSEPTSEAHDPDYTGRPGEHTAEARGVLFLTGPGVRAGATLHDVGVLDVAPTVAWLLDLPLADDLPGRVISEAFDRRWLHDHPPQRVPTWGERERGESPTSAADELILEQLRSLGYVE